MGVIDEIGGDLCCRNRHFGPGASTRPLPLRKTEEAEEIAEARAAYQKDKVRRGTVADLMKELAE